MSEAETINEGKTCAVCSGLGATFGPDGRTPCAPCEGTGKVPAGTIMKVVVEDRLAPSRATLAALAGTMIAFAGPDMPGLAVPPTVKSASRAVRSPTAGLNRHTPPPRVQGAREIARRQKQLARTRVREGA